MSDHHYEYRSVGNDEKQLDKIRYDCIVCLEQNYTQNLRRA